MRANLKSITHRCHLTEVVFVWELTGETIHLPLGCLQGGSGYLDSSELPHFGRSFAAATRPKPPADPFCGAVHLGEDERYSSQFKNNHLAEM